MIVIYVFKRPSGEYLYKGTGVKEYLLYDIKDDEDYTLEPYPIGQGLHKWNGSEWVKVETE